MRLNGWQRIGIVASIAWALGAAIYVRNLQIDSGNRFATTMYTHCMDVTKADPGFCLRKFGDDLKVGFTPNWEIVAFYAIAPVLAAWIAIYAIVGIVRWIKKGFEKPPPAS